MRRGTVTLCAAILASALGGCITDDAGTGDVADPSGPEAAFALPTGIPSAEELAARSLLAPPQWRLGEWWRFAVDVPLTGDSYEATVVVAGAREGEILLGMPEDEFDDAATVIHIPPTGPLRVDDLSWHFHADMFPMGPFPLEAGKEWSFSWFGGDTAASVVSVGEATADIEAIHPNARITYTYDAALGFVTDFAWEGLVSFEVTDHGFDHHGPVLVPDAMTLAIFAGRLAGGVDAVRGLQPGPPVEMVDIGEEYDTLSLGFILGTAGLPGTGVFRAAATAPDGTQYEEILLPTDGAATVLRATRVADPAGTWRLDFEAAGPGVAIVEAMAYKSLVVEV